MGKKILTAMIVAVVAVVASYNIYAAQRTVGLSDIALTDTEALAACEVSVVHYNAGHCVKDVSLQNEYCAEYSGALPCYRTI